MAQNTSPDGQWTPSIQVDGRDENVMHAVGQMILCMAEAETALYRFARHISGVEEPIFRIFANEMKSNQLQRIVKDVMVLKEYPEELISDVEKILARLAFLRDRRNQVAHWLWYQEPDGSGFNLKKHSEHPDPLPVTLNEIRQWADELGDLTLSLLLRAQSKNKQRNILKKIQAWLDSQKP